MLRRVNPVLTASASIMIATASASGFPFNITSFREPTTDTTLAGDINDSGLVTANAFNLSGGGPRFDFLYDSVAGTSTFFSVPGSTQTSLASLNNAGVVVGGAVVGGVSRGWLRDTVGGFSFFDRPGFAGTNFSDINDDGLIVGFNTVRDPFLFDGTNYTGFDIPGSTFIAPLSINNMGDVVGYYRTTLRNAIGSCEAPDMCEVAGNATKHAGLRTSTRLSFHLC